MDKNKHDDGKIRPTLIPTSALRYISMAREYGLKKYPETGREGWKEVGRERITDALFRHLINYIEDPSGVDEESGLPIIAHIACNAAFLCWFNEIGNDISDREGLIVDGIPLEQYYKQKEITNERKNRQS